ncbi:MAG: NAD(P)-binding protein [Blautia sp.]|nr:NAD(P)-binding protein [Blautia sp.]
MIRITQLKLPVGHSEQELRERIAKTLRVPPDGFSYEKIRQSLDAREKSAKIFVYTVDVTLPEEQKVFRKLTARHKGNHNNIMLTNPVPYTFPVPGTEPLRERPVIVGCGPAGLFCAWYLARAGYRPLVLERGDEARIRREKVDAFWEKGVLDPDSNVQFGEGGAGTFSDGKLNTLVKDPNGRNREVLKRLVDAGAPEEILYQQKPHLGTDVLVGIVEKLRHQIEDMGGEVRFRTCVTDFQIRDGNLTGLVLNEGETLPATCCVLAIGHSARDTFRVLHERGIHMEPKAFAVGVRIEHSQAMINLDQYGSEEEPLLGAAAYKLTHSCENGRGVYTFCMCPGGYVVNASTEEGRLAVNGMSYQKRDSQNANSALIVTVKPEDFPEDGPLGGIRFQRDLEEAAFREGNGRIPVQLYQDFKEDRISAGLQGVTPCMKGAWSFGNLRKVFPVYISESLIEGIESFGRKIKGYDRPDAVLSGVESRTSSPVRILRNEAHLANIGGIYPCGEGAGYAGGITSAAMDGIKIAEAIAGRFYLC